MGPIIAIFRVATQVLRATKSIRKAKMEAKGLTAVEQVAQQKARSAAARKTTSEIANKAANRIIDYGKSMIPGYKEVNALDHTFNSANSLLDRTAKDPIKVATSILKEALSSNSPAVVRQAQTALQSLGNVVDATSAPKPFVNEDGNLTAEGIEDFAKSFSVGGVFHGAKSLQEFNIQGIDYEKVEAAFGVNQKDTVATSQSKYFDLSDDEKQLLWALYEEGIVDRYIDDDLRTYGVVNVI